MKKVTKNSIGLFYGLKGILVLFVPFAHSLGDVQVPDGGWPLTFVLLAKIFSFGTFAFLIISGYQYVPNKRRSVVKIALTELKTYLIAAFGILLCWILHNLIFGLNWNYQLRDIFLGAFYGTYASEVFGMRVQPAVAMWFFMAATISYLILTQVLKIANKLLQRLVAFGPWLVFFAVYTITGSWGKAVLNKLPFFILPAILAVPLQYIGYKMKEQDFFAKQWPKYAYVICAVLGLASFVCSVSYVDNRYKFGPFDYIFCVAYALCWIWFYYHTFSPDIPIISEGLMFLGKNSMYFVIIHCWEWVLLRMDTWEVFSSMDFSAAVLIIFIIRSVLDIVLLIIFDKIKKEAVKKKMQKGL